MDHKCCVQLAIIGYSITLDKVPEANDICDGFLAQLIASFVGASVISHGILVGKYLAEYRDLLK